jgi:hypothetical protein
MSRKRSRDGSLTGGTGDVNPQWMSFSEVQTGNDTATGGSVQPPVSLSTGEKLAMEILKIALLYENQRSETAGANTANFWLSTKNFGTTYPALGLGDATVLLSNAYGGVSDSAVGFALVPGTVFFDYTDGDGHGVLVGNQNLYWGITSSSTGQANRFSVKILYRAKRISDSELLGIVLQSNQN